VDHRLPTSNWVTVHLTLRTVPSFYPLERTHVSIIGMDVALIHNLVSYMATEMSLAATYKSADQAYLTVEDGTLISVQLFQEDEYNIILEVQRLAGQGETFYHHAAYILQIAKGVDHVREMKFQDFNAPKQPKLEVPSEMMLEPTEEKEAAESDLSMAAHLLNVGYWDNQELGLQLLALLTDEAKSSPVCCTVASKAILFEDKFAQSLMKLLSVPSKNVDVEDDTLIDSYENVLKKKVLQILSNALLVFSEQKISLESSWIVDRHEEVVNYLLNYLKEAKFHPHEAVFATRCLERFMLLSEEATRIAVHNNVVKLVSQARNVGECSHALLASESERAYNLLRNAGFRCV